MHASTWILAAYLGTLGLIALHGVHRLVTLWRFRRRGAPRGRPYEVDLPVVTVQVPLFDERAVAARVIRAAGALEWPRERLEIQVLDDSTDETRAIVDREVAALVRRGLEAKVLRRAERRGFKAGALAAGLAAARGELVAVFDADFVPAPDFLRRLVGVFRDPRVGMVQARWGHANRDESWLTRAQAVLLDGHFVVEHAARCRAGLFFNFNGTAGIWRRAAIEDAGGWRADTLTEDLDLSYRAQLAGWRFVYAPEVVAPAEVPPTLAAFRSQQHRWAKGSAQVLRKLGRPLAHARQPLRVRLEALLHLTSNVGYPAVLLLALLLPAAALAPRPAGEPLGALAFVLCAVSVLAFYEAGQRAVGRPLRRRAADALAAIALGIGLSASQTRAVWEGLTVSGGDFLRTPKRGDGSARGYRSAARGAPLAELALAAWLAVGIAAASLQGAWGSVPFLALFLAGFAWVATLALRERRAAARRGA